MIQLPGSGSRRPTDATPHATRRGADGSGSFDGVFTRAQVDNFQDIFTECVRRHNGIHAIGIYSLAGEPVAYDQNIAKKKADEQRAYYEQFGTVCRGLFPAYKEMRLGTPGRERGDAVAEDVGEPRHIRISVGEHYIGLTPLDDGDQFFLVVVSFGRDGYHDAIFASELHRFREEVRRAMGW
jgi:hypothetical protein